MPQFLKKRLLSLDNSMLLWVSKVQTDFKQICPRAVPAFATVLTPRNVLYGSMAIFQRRWEICFCQSIWHGILRAQNQLISRPGFVALSGLDIQRLTLFAGYKRESYLRTSILRIAGDFTCSYHREKGVPFPKCIELNRICYPAKTRCRILLSKIK